MVPVVDHETTTMVRIGHVDGSELEVETTPRAAATTTTTTATTTTTEAPTTVVEEELRVSMLLNFITDEVTNKLVRFSRPNLSSQV